VLRYEEQGCRPVPRHRLDAHRLRFQIKPCVVVTFAQGDASGFRKAELIGCLDCFGQLSQCDKVELASVAFGAVHWNAVPLKPF